jgi:hypothetical protein
MRKCNVFYQFHKGLRAILYETAIVVQQTDFSNETEAAETVKKIHAVLTLFDKHAHSEDSYVLPAIAAYEPSVVTLFEDEHVQNHTLSDRLIALLNMLSTVETDGAKEELGSAIRTAFQEFIAFNLTHMAKEERDLNKLLWNYLRDEELHAITMEIIAHIPGHLLAAYNVWMMRGLSNYEIINWLRQIKNTAPDDVFSSLMQIAETELPEARFCTITEALTEGALLA